MLSYSQPATGQDLWVLEHAPKHGGYFVEIGAYDGLHHSNTWLLESEFGWDGLLVEPNPDMFRKLTANRPNCALSDKAVYGCNGSGIFIRGDLYSGMLNTMPRGWLDGHTARNNPVMEVRTVTLLSLLKQYSCPRVIDYLSLDVEGAELSILESFVRDGGHDRFQFRTMTVEFRYDQGLLSRLMSLLSPHYELVECRAFDACFISTDEEVLKTCKN